MSQLPSGEYLVYTLVLPGLGLGPDRLAVQLGRAEIFRYISMRWRPVR